MRKALFVVVPLLIIILFTLVACESTPKPFPPPASQETPTTIPTPEPASAPVETTTPAPTTIELTAQELYSAYEANQVAADAKYEDKTLIVTGVVDSIGKDILDTPYVTLTSSGAFAVWGVQCMFDDEHEPELAKLTKGQMVTVQGKCDGYLLNVLLRDCTLIGSLPVSAQPVLSPPPVTTTVPAPTTQPTPSPAPTPTQTSFEPIVMTGSGGKTTPPFTVTTEEWVVDWSYTSDDPAFAIFGFFIYPRGETVSFVESCLFPEGTSGSTYSYAGAGEYYIKVEAANIKSWTLTISPSLTKESTPTPTPETTPPPTSFESIVMTGSGGKTTPPFTVTTEEWVIDWSYTSDDPEFAVFGFFVYPRGETVMYVEACLFPEGTSGSTYSYAGAGEYYIKVEAANIKTWTITIKPTG